MKKKFEIYIFEYWVLHGGKESNPIALNEVYEDLDIPLFDSEPEALKWYLDVYKKEQARIDTENQKTKSNFKPNWLVSAPKLAQNELPKQIYLRECWVIE